MKSTTSFLLTSCLLILTALWGCEASDSESTTGSANFAPISHAELEAKIKQSERPYTLVNFYAQWCKPCKIELPELVELQKDEKSKVQVLLVSMDKPEDVQAKLAPFLQEYQVDFPSYTGGDDPQSLIRAFIPDWDGYIPVSLIFDQSGNLIEQVGMTDKQEIEMILNRHEMLN